MEKMQTELRVLILEDVPSDAELMQHELRRSGIAFVAQRVDTREAFVQALEAFRPDIVLADYWLPAFDGREALQIVRSAHPDVPVIIVTGALGDEAVIELLKGGARDYILKDNLARLSPVIQRALSEEQSVRARKAAERALRDSEERFRTMAGAARDAIMMMDDQGRIVFWNEAAARIFGFPEVQALGKLLHELIVPERLRAQAAAALARLCETKGGAMLGHTVELPALRRDGTEFLVEHAISITQIGGKWHAIGIVRDVTERREAQLKLEEQLDELKRFQNVTVGRELRMQELVEENRRLKAQLEKLQGGG